MPIPKEIKNVIFDLGGVLLNLDVARTYHQFSSISGKSVAQLRSEASNLSFFNDYEEGLISDDDFRNELRVFLNKEVSDSEIDFAWNAMLLDLPISKVKLLERLRREYSIFLLSNTNNIHLQCFTSIVNKAFGINSLDHYFERTYYSHLLKMRKPNVEIYKHVLETNNLVAQETLFLDDNESNLTGAAQVGIQTYHVMHPDHVFTFFNEPAH